MAYLLSATCILKSHYFELFSQFLCELKIGQFNCIKNYVICHLLTVHLYISRPTVKASFLFSFFWFSLCRIVVKANEISGYEKASIYIVPCNIGIHIVKMSLVLLCLIFSVNWSKRKTDVRMNSVSIFRIINNILSFYAGATRTISHNVGSHG